VEALGYLGGVIVVIAVTAIAAQGWADLATAWRLLVLGAAVAVPLGAGLAVPSRLGDAGTRLRAGLWMVSTVTCAGFRVAADRRGPRPPRPPRRWFPDSELVPYVLLVAGAALVLGAVRAARRRSAAPPGSTW
jgi:hypothetical protein